MAGRQLPAIQTNSHDERLRMQRRASTIAGTPCVTYIEERPRTYFCNP